MTGAVLFRGAVVLPAEVLEDGAVLCVDGKIEAVGRRDEVRGDGDVVAEAQLAPGGVRIAGVHLYGPFFAEDKVGCHSLSGRRDPDPAEYCGYFDTGLVRVATCAAELPGAEDYYHEAAARGCLVTCGHSNASWAEMARAFGAGMRHVDHFWCAMSSIPSVSERLGTPMQGSRVFVGGVEV